MYETPEDRKHHQNKMSSIGESLRAKLGSRDFGKKEPNCLGCGKDMTTIKGYRPAKFCSGECKNNYEKSKNI